MYERSEREINFQTQAINDAKEKQLALEEERRQAAAAKAAAAAKKKKGGKKDAVVEEDEKKNVEEKVVVQQQKELDLNIPVEFKQALAEKVGRPFIFGPIEFTELNANESENPFNHEL